MHTSFRLARIVVVVLIAAIFLVGIGGANATVMWALLTALLFSASYLGFYAYVNPKRVADHYARQSALSAWLSGAIAYNTPAKAKAYGLFFGILTLTLALVVLVGLLTRWGA
jgi:hypothetical protein